MSNVQKLRKAGFTIDRNTPKAYRDVIEELSDVEVALLTNMRPLLRSVERRLDQAQKKSRESSYTQYFAPPPL